ncbi:MAG: hypothetical protein A2W90_09875 [Bacteroidetes bacterium GWF2_42_66]|nr:MAG: hypothetical protein A2W92_05125 [Bacteroidetes bacterium GWA2_42_15]OFX97529.1 MAG: hypothetical protein A2W89_01530 [Bacteroidetes bacterium GWE2_42_39]OFY43776.1 MAG: hypothetical protein A2W90_09875 [Bacteroidetes bacterium GWF2_42_66]HBL76246.1 hypothetical protein [Prolixibacteraceae bacterium]HCR90343.1 hypothetical protein [Prolixibacteraceae bacterium]
MTNKIKILHLEDSFKDSELVHSFIESGEIDHEYFLAENEKDFIRILGTENIDIILSDYSLPGYNGNDALKFAREKYPQLPFIFVSGKIEENAAIDAMLNGATDYVLKNKPERLVPAINRAMYEHELVINRKQAEINLREKNILIEAQNQKYIQINKELEFQNREKGKRADELIIANIELAFQNKEKEKRAAELIIANKELIFQNREKEKRADEFIIANIELAFQNKEKEKRAAELIIANKELIFQNREKGKRADELIIANRELAFQNKEKEIRAAELIIANKELAFQNNEKEKRANEYSILNEELTRSLNQIQNINNELVIAKNNAEESDKLKSAFLANMSHEIRTPLNAIIGFSVFLLDPGLSKENLEDFIQIINTNSQHLLSIISDIMDISKMETGQFAIDSELVDIGKLINELFITYKKLVDPQKINLNCVCDRPNDLIQIKTDGNRIKQVICNLLNNAIKFTEKGKIEFGYRIKENFMEFYVKDNGIGIAPENQNIVFQRFRQVEATNHQLNGGNGLGLSISKAIVEKLGGTIFVRSELGKGSNFVFTIPYKKETKNTVIPAFPSESGQY